MADVFTTTTFSGNVAAVCPFTDWLPDETSLKMTQQHSQSETAFFVTDENSLELRWFTIQDEISLCRHAMLAAAHVTFEHLGYPGTKIQFATCFVGLLTVTRYGEWLTLDSPAWPSESATPSVLLSETLGVIEYKEMHVVRDYIAVLENQQQVEAVRPNVHVMLPLGKMVYITASSDGECDFVSRFFCPGKTVAEDPVTDSVHSMLIPYWVGKLNKAWMLARQVSERGGDLRCQLAGARICISR